MNVLTCASSSLAALASHTAVPPGAIDSAAVAIAPEVALLTIVTYLPSGAVPSAAVASGIHEMPPVVEVS